VLFDLLEGMGVHATRVPERCVPAEAADWRVRVRPAALAELLGTP
jgi:hypothetical protein